MPQCPTCNGYLISTGWGMASWPPIVEHVCEAGHISWWQKLHGVQIECVQYRHRPNAMVDQSNG